MPENSRAWSCKGSTLLTVLCVILLAAGCRASYWPCETQDDCTAQDSGCTLSAGQCECASFDIVFSEDFTRCLATSLFGDACEENVQCNLMPSGANCKAGVCDCADGHTYVRGRCRPLNGLSESCETDLDCYFGYDRESVACENKLCACANGYYQRHGNICRRRSMELGDDCVVDADCEEVGANVKCASLSCQYVDELAAANAAQRNLTQENGKRGSVPAGAVPRTRIPPQARSLSESLLSSQLSSLRSDTDHNTDRNTPMLANGRDDGDDSNNGFTDTEFNVDAPTQRKVGHKSREIAVQTSIEAFELKALPPAQPEQGPAATVVKNVGTATTSTSTSSTRRQSYYNNYRQHRPRRPFAYRYSVGGGVAGDEDDKTFSTISNTDDEFDDGKFGSSCTENGKPCGGLPHSLCSNSICLCRQGYYQKGGKCFAELGEIAESVDECEHTFNELSKKCICQKNYFYERNLRSCRKPIQYHLSCTSNSQCSPFGASYCHPDIPRRCTCEEYAEYDAMQQLCIYKQGLGAQCDTNASCTVENAVCNSRYCVCKENFFEKDDTCLPGVGAACEENEECAVQNSLCEQPSTTSDDQDKTCKCRKGFVHFKDECVKEAEELGDECVDTEQCVPLLATCSSENKCDCTSEQHFKFGRCESKKGLGDPCARAGECFVEKNEENVECRNSVCQCKFGYQADEAQKTCIRVLPNKKNSSGRPSALKIITFMLIGSAFLITSAAIKQAYY